MDPREFVDRKKRLMQEGQNRVAREARVMQEAPVVSERCFALLEELFCEESRKVAPRYLGEEIIGHILPPNKTYYGSELSELLQFSVLRNDSAQVPGTDRTGRGVRFTIFVGDTSDEKYLFAELWVNYPEDTQTQLDSSQPIHERAPASQCNFRFELPDDSEDDLTRLSDLLATIHRFTTEGVAYQSLDPTHAR